MHYPDTDCCYNLNGQSPFKLSLAIFMAALLRDCKSIKVLVPLDYHPQSPRHLSFALRVSDSHSYSVEQTTQAVTKVEFALAHDLDVLCIQPAVVRIKRG